MRKVISWGPVLLASIALSQWFYVWQCLLFWVKLTQISMCSTAVGFCKVAADLTVFLATMGH